MPLNTLNVGKLKFIISSLKGLNAKQLGVELDRLCADQEPISFYNYFFQALDVRRKNILFMGPPGVGVGTCMRMVEPVLMVSASHSCHDVDPVVSLKISDSKGDAAGYRVWTNRREVCVPWRADSRRIRDSQSDGSPPSATVPLRPHHGRFSANDPASGSTGAIDIAIAFSMPKEIVVKKLTSRRACPHCNRSYILSAIREGDIDLPAYPPKHPGICDDCGTPLVVRADDNPKIIESRFDIFEERTKPVLEYYRSKNVLREHPIKKGVQDLPDILRSILIQYLVKYN